MELYLENNCKILSAIFAVLNFFISAFLLGRILFSGFRFRRNSSGVIIFTLLGADILGLIALLSGKIFDSKLPFLTILLLFFLLLVDKDFRVFFFFFLKLMVFFAKNLF